MGNKKKKKFKLFDSQREGPGVTKEEAKQPPNLRTFFKKFWRHLPRLISVNIFMVLGNFPFIFAIIAYAGYFNYTSETAGSLLYPVLNGALTITNTPPLTALFGILGLHAGVSMNSTLTLVSYGLTALLLFTFGIVNVGTTYILRNLIKGDPVFMWSDFWYAVKKNFKQGFFFGIFDLIITVLLVYDVYFFSMNLGGAFINSLFFYMTLVFGCIYFFMRFYIYLMMITFDLGIFKILKNALIFVFLGIKRNIVALLGIISCCLLTYILLVYFMPLGISLPFIILFAACSYMAIYAAYFKIKEIMIDPYYKEEEKPAEEPGEE